MVNVATPDEAEPEALPPLPVYEPLALIEQTLVPDVWETAMVSVDDATRTPFASLTLTVNLDVLEPSEAIVVGLNPATSWAAAPGLVVAMLTLQPVRPEALREITAVPLVVVESYTFDATPFALVIVSGSVPLSAVRIVGVLFEKVMFVLLLLATTLPFASRSVPVTVVVLLALSAGMLVGAAAHEMCVAEPKTVTGAETEAPPALATTAHGWVGEFVAVAAKRPLVVTAPHPPVTVHVTVAPAAAPLTVNCCWPPTGSAAEVGEIVRVVVVEGVVLIW